MFGGPPSIRVRMRVRGTAAAALVLTALTVFAVAGDPPPAAAAAPAPHVVLVGIGGLRWSDVSPANTPRLWQLAAEGSAGSLIVGGVNPRTCPAAGWLTLNAAARSSLPHSAAGPCPASPAVITQPALAAPGTPRPALVPQLPGLVRYNAQFHYNPQWGLLARSAGPGHCATAVGRGAALALAGPAGRVTSYLAAPSSLTPAVLARCALTVVDLGNLPSGSGPAGHAARTAAARSFDGELGRVLAGMPAGTTLVVAAPGDGSAPHLRVIIVTGPGYRAGLLTASSTRQPGIVALTDLTPSVLGWFGTPVPSAVVGSPLRATARPAGAGSLPATLRTLTAQDTAAQVYRDTVTPFFLLVGFGYSVLFGLIWAAPWGAAQARRRRRRAVARAVGVWAASVPAGTFLASLVPWWTLAHPAAVLYGAAVAWAALIAATALAGPWRRDPLGPPGVVAAVTLAVIGLDMMTGSRLALETPFGLSLLEAGRFYGLGNNAVAIYGAAGIICAAWLGGAVLRKGSRTQALVVMAAVTAFAVIAAGWPGFGAKVGGTVAMVPGFLLLAAVAAGIRLTARRVALAAVSGVALVTVFALINYFVPVSGHSDIGGFVGQALHGGAGGILARKVSSNIGSLTANPFVLVIPVVVVVLGLAVGWPARMRAGLLASAYRQVPLLRAALSAIWLTGVLGWFAEDSGVTVPASALPLVLPLAVVILSSVRPDPPEPVSDSAVPTDRAVPGPAQSGYR